MKKRKNQVCETPDQVLEEKDQNKKTEEQTSSESSQIEIEGKIENLSEVELKQAEEKISVLENQITELKDFLLRKAAEFENYKRRTENDQLNLLKYAAEPFIISMLTVYDDLERSLEHVNDNNSFESLKKGLELVYEKFTKILELQGVKKIDAKGEPFSVDLHEALMQRPVEGVDPHTVLDVIEHGYTYKDKVIRHAKVIVSAEIIHDESDTKNSNENSEG